MNKVTNQRIIVPFGAGIALPDLTLHLYYSFTMSAEFSAHGRETHRRL